MFMRYFKIDQLRHRRFIIVYYYNKKRKRKFLYYIIYLNNFTLNTQNNIQDYVF